MSDSVEGKVKVLPVGIRPPLDKMFAQVQQITADLGKMFVRVRLWKTQAPSPRVEEILTSACEAMSEAVGELNTVSQICHSLKQQGFRPQESKVGHLQTGDRVEIRKNSKTAWLELADQPEDLNHLVVSKIVGGEVVLDVDAGGGFRRFGVVKKGQLALKKGGAK